MRNKDSLKHQLRVTALDGITDNDSRRAYRRGCDSFAAWAKDEGIRDLSEVTVDIVQKYEEYIEHRPEQYSAATIHSKLAPVCKAAGVNMAEIRKPKRTASRITRGRGATKTGRSEHELLEPRYQRLVTLQMAVGIRRAELAALTGIDLIESSNGSLWVYVRRGKGGKAQRQYILPEDREAVREVFREIAADEKVFSAEEMNNHINLHRMRAERAQRCYHYFVGLLSTDTMRDSMRRYLISLWDERKGNHSGAARRRYMADMDERPYVLRGENKTKATALGLPVEYDRLALMAVSILCLSHWRLDVTVVNYMVQ